ncbi:MAG TPA: hypothetical protein PLD20_19680 [Blastocatellia bacterium]|nr:hypothetical protein [Blastocatellia bacterium]HMY73410.1 hypothetical protein [Blastocatellia bacterium]HMZ20169.1 hypothetical protein [Blastocatellia bacterium]HNG30134.1 hypothetical protein [Blastocatellia bacterium]
MQARRTLVPGQKGTKKFLDHYGEKLICVRYRYDERRRKRMTTVEIIVEESAWTPPAIAEPVIVGLRVGINEVAVQRQIKQAGGKWNRQLQVWEILSDRAIALGLTDRIQNPEVSNSRHQPVTDKRTVEVSNTRR